MKNTSIKLKPCVFCGGKVIFSPAHRLNGEIKCTKCKAKMLAYTIPDSEDWEEKLANIWNNRINEGR